MRSYKVIWEIELDADSPEEAAREAFKLVKDPDSWATVFTVIDPGGHEKEVDLSSDNEIEL